MDKIHERRARDLILWARLLPLLQGFSAASCEWQIIEREPETNLYAHYKEIREFAAFKGIKGREFRELIQLQLSRRFTAQSVGILLTTKWHLDDSCAFFEMGWIHSCAFFEMAWIHGQRDQHGQLNVKRVLNAVQNFNRAILDLLQDVCLFPAPLACLVRSFTWHPDLDKPYE